MAALYESSENEKSAFEDRFQEEFKRYKRRKPPPDLSGVINFRNNDLVENSKIFQVPSVPCPECHMNRVGLHDPSKWKIFGHQDFPGFYFIVNPFRDGGQRYWIKQCLTNYPHKPHVSNLDAHDKYRESDLWEFCKQKMKNGTTLHATDLYKLRWVTLGYHYDWTAKVYYEDHHTEFPADLGELSSCLAQGLGFKQFTAEAAIINFYHLNSTLAGHTDHSEFDKEAPLFSLSFGPTAIFLLGGLTREMRPLAMYLESGDVVVMSGASRLAYHAVPRVLPIKRKELVEIFQMNHFTEGLETEKDFETMKLEMDFYLSYLLESRLNMNVRQVLQPGQKFPSQEKNKESEINPCQSETSSCKSEISTCKSEIGSCKSEIGSHKSEISSQESEISSRKRFKSDSLD